MLEFGRVAHSVWSIYADPGGLDGFAEDLDGGEVVRVAPDEAMAITPDDRGGKHFLWGSDDKVLVDASDGWVCWSLEGDAVRVAFAMLSEVSLPEGGAISCEVAHIPARVIQRSRERIDIFVASPHEAYLRERILEDCASLKPREVEPA